MSEGRFSWVCGENISRKEISVTGIQKANCSASVMTFYTYISEAGLNHLNQGSSVTNIFPDEVGSSAVSLPWVLTPPTDFTVCVYQV